MSNFSIELTVEGIFSLLGTIATSIQNGIINVIKFITLILLFIVVVNLLMPIFHLNQILSFMKLSAMSDLKLAIIPAIYYIIK